MSVWTCTAQISFISGSDVVGLNQPRTRRARREHSCVASESAAARSPSADSACASATSRFTGFAPRCGTVCVGSASNAAQTSSPIAAFGLELAAVDQDAATANRRQPVDLPGHVLDDVARRRAVEERQDAVDGVQPVVAGDASGERAADHATEELRDVRLVLAPAGRTTSTSARGQSHPVEIASFATSTRTVGRLLHPLRLDPVDLPCAERLRPSRSSTCRTDSAVRSGMTPRIASSALPTSSASGVFGVWNDQQRHDRLGELLLCSAYRFHRWADSFSVCARRGDERESRSRRPRPGCRERGCP